MIFDDSHPDYFLSDSSTENPATANVADGRKIEFATDGEGAGQSSGMEPSGSGTEPPRKRHLLRKIIAWTVGVCVVALGIIFYLRYYNPYVVDATVDAYVVNVEKRGVVFKTWEAQVVETAAVADTTSIYSHPVQFSIASDQLAHKLQLYQGQRREVKITYEKYYATLPWRGASKWVITAVAGE